MNTILTNLNSVIPDTGVKVLDFIKGDIWIVPNVSGGDNRLVFSGRGGKYFERVTKYLIKPKGSSKIMSADDLSKQGILFISKDEEKTLADLGVNADIAMEVKAKQYRDNVLNKIGGYVPYNNEVKWGAYRLRNKNKK